MPRKERDEKRRDSKGRLLKSGESQRPDGSTVDAAVFPVFLHEAEKSSFHAVGEQYEQESHVGVKFNDNPVLIRSESVCVERY